MQMKESIEKVLFYDLCRTVAPATEAAHAAADAPEAPALMVRSFSHLVCCRHHGLEVWRRTCFALCIRARSAPRDYRPKQPDFQRLWANCPEHSLPAHHAWHHCGGVT